MTRRQVLRYGGGLFGFWSLAVAAMALTAKPEPAQVSAFPAYVNAGAQPAYAAALAEPDLMRSLPCYCGCVNLAVPHRHLYDCFVTPAGQVEPHAAGCGLCQVEALHARRLALEGLSIAAIRQQIDVTYGESGPGTHTAPV